MNKKAKITLTNSNARLIPSNASVRHHKPISALNLSSISQNSNTRITRGNRPVGVVPSEALRNQVRQALLSNDGMNSEQLRLRMVERLKQKHDIHDERVLKAMLRVHRHLFMDSGMAIRAYDDAALPIGYGQTISMPSVVARMISVAIAGRHAGKVLEIGSGCGYQAAVLACVFDEVYSIERIAGLYELAKRNMAKIADLPKVNLVLGDGMLGLPGQGPFDAIVVAAAGLEIPKALFYQLSIGGRLIAPEGDTQQRLVLLERTGPQTWDRTELEETRFVPLCSGILR